MPAWVTDLIPVAPWLAAFGVLAWVGYKLWPFIRKFSHFIDDVAGEPARPGFPARPGLMERLSLVEGKQDDLTAAVRVVQHEVTTNHGSSLKDATKRLEGRVNDMESQISDLHEKFVKEN